MTNAMTSLFRKLTPAEIEAFEAWARENWKPDTPVNPLWHPVVRAEWARLDVVHLQESA